MMMLDDCFRAFLSKCSREFELADFGDFISNSILSRRISAVCRLDFLRNITLWPAEAKIVATFISWGQGLVFAGMMTFPIF